MAATGAASSKRAAAALLPRPRKGAVRYLNGEITKGAVFDPDYYDLKGHDYGKTRRAGSENWGKRVRRVHERHKLHPTPSFLVSLYMPLCPPPNLL